MNWHFPAAGTLSEIWSLLRFWMFAIAAGYEDADDCHALRHDAVFKMAVGWLLDHPARRH